MLGYTERKEGVGGRLVSWGGRNRLKKLVRESNPLTSNSTEVECNRTIKTVYGFQWEDSGERT